MNARTTALAPVLAAVFAGVTISLISAPAALAAPAAPVDPGVYQPAPELWQPELTWHPEPWHPPTLPTRPTYAPPTLVLPTYVPPTTTPPTTTPPTTPPATTPPTTKPPTTTQPKPQEPPKFPKGAPETGAGGTQYTGVRPGLALVVLGLGAGGLAAAAQLGRRRRDAHGTQR